MTQNGSSSSVAWSSRPSVSLKSSGETPKARVRLAILGDSPCDLCDAACCRQNGHAYAARIEGDEIRKFAAFAIDVPITDDDGRLRFERVLPYVNGRCQFLDSDERCAIYDDRPRACRQFQCVAHYNAEGVGRHGVFLQRNPRVRAMLDEL
jgi:Fe-S-cluster containining protein